MQDFHFVGKLVVATFGTITSFILESFSNSLSLVAAALTVVYLLYNIKLIRLKVEEKVLYLAKIRSEKKD